MRRRAKTYIAFVVALGAASFAARIARFAPPDPLQFWLYFLIADVTSGLKVRLPVVFSTLSVNFLFILVGIAEFSLPEAMAIGASGILVQCLWRPKVRPRTVQIAFSVAAICLAVDAAYWVFHGPLAGALSRQNPVRLGLAALAYYAVNTSLVAGVIALTEARSFADVWRKTYLWVLPYHMAAASVAWLIVGLGRQEIWSAGLVLFPLAYFVYRSYRLYVDRLEEEKRHVEELAGLHLRTVEALALAIEAKDAGTHDHLQRVRVYATEIGRELGMKEPDLEALRAAALLHDIGKLAVPEHIISKPGRLTPEEFEKMKIHPLVGAEILEEVKFPYPVVPIVRAHHEKWDGLGYPYGLSGENIPLGARILAVVDCFDALTSDRQYRRAVTPEEAMEIVSAESGRSFDPAVVGVLRRRHAELERLALAGASAGERIRLSMDVKVERGQAPATGFADSGEADAIVYGGSQRDPLASIAEAAQEAQMLYELTQDLGSSLSLQEALAFVGVRLQRLIPYDTLVTYIRRDDKVAPEYVCGENLRLFAALEIPLGKGLSGWVTENNKPILNGDPGVEAGYPADPSARGTLHSALVVPLNGVNGTLGALGLYRAERDAFSRENLRILSAISAKVAFAIENALNHRLRETSIAIDYLTNLPNARSLFLTLDHEMARAQRDAIALAVVVCDLDGFKQLNDRLGHLAGNKVLRMVADGLRAQCGESDYVARMGGDEFVMLIPMAKRDDASIESLESRLERLREVARDAGLATPEPSALSMSVGVAIFPEDGRDAEGLLAEADRRMYKSKRLRRKRVVMLPSERAKAVAAAS